MTRQCEALTGSGDRCTYGANFEHYVFAGRAVCGHHQWSYFLIPLEIDGGRMTRPPVHEPSRQALAMAAMAFCVLCFVLTVWHLTHLT